MLAAMLMCHEASVGLMKRNPSASVLFFSLNRKISGFMKSFQ